MNEPQRPASSDSPFKPLFEQMAQCFQGMRVNDEHALYLVRDLEGAAREAGIFEVHEAIGERIVELRRWIEQDQWGDALKELPLPE